MSFPSLVAQKLQRDSPCLVPRTPVPGLRPWMCTWMCRPARPWGFLLSSSFVKHLLAPTWRPPGGQLRPAAAVPGLPDLTEARPRVDVRPRCRRPTCVPEPAFSRTPAFRGPAFRGQGWLGRGVGEPCLCCGTPGRPAASLPPPLQRGRSSNEAVGSGDPSHGDLRPVKDHFWRLCSPGARSLVRPLPEGAGRPRARAPASLRGPRPPRPRPHLSGEARAWGR